jgi:hypothetical protein
MGLAVLGHAADDTPAQLRDPFGFEPRAIAFELRYLGRSENGRGVLPASTFATEKQRRAASVRHVPMAKEFERSGLHVPDMFFCQMGSQTSKLRTVTLALWARCPTS